MNVDNILEAGLLDHCVFCMRNIGKEVPLPQVLSLHGFLNSLNEVWECLRSQCMKKRNVNDSDVQPDITLKHFIGTGSSETFHSIPCICQPCAGTVQAVGELLKALRTHLTTLSQVILESRRGGKHSRRGELFGIKLRECYGEENVLMSTMQLLNSMCASEIQATVKPESINQDNDLSTPLSSPYNEDFDEDNDADNSSDKDPNYMIEKGEEKVSIEKNQICMNISDPLEDSASTSARVKRKRKLRTGGVYTKTSKKYFCRFNDCGKAFLKQSKLKFHQQSCHPETIPPEVPKFPCTCGKAFFVKRDLDLHIKTDLETHPKLEVHPREHQLYTCDMCGNRVNKRDRFEHIISHVGEDYVVRCPNEKCSVMVTNSTALQAHMKCHQDCKQAAIAKNVGITCETCGHVEEGRNQLRTHVQSAHERSAVKNYKCPMTGCEMRFCVRQSVDLHLSAHTLRKITKQKCEHCSRKFKVEEIGDHLKTCHQADDVFYCPQCPFIYSSRLLLLEHMRNHRQLGLLCDICNDGVKYPTFLEFRQHYHNVHQIGEKKWSCDQCNKTYFSELSLYFHVRTKHMQLVDPKTVKKAQNGKKFSCDLCFYDVKFSTRKSLEAHEISVHGKDPFTCETCGETFTNRTSLNNHKKGHAGMQNEWKCEMEGCGKVFERKAMYLRHKSYHGDRTFVCDLCGKAYFDKNTLKAHRGSVHLKLRPCVCEECGEGFVNAGILKNHKRIHTGERPFSCDVCGQRFRQIEVLRRHVDAHRKKGDDFKKKGPMKRIRKRTNVLKTE